MQTLQSLVTVLPSKPLDVSMLHAGHAESMNEISVYHHTNTRSTRSHTATTMCTTAVATLVAQTPANDQSQWLVAPSPEEYRSEFIALGPNPVGKITGQQAKTKMVQSKLPSNALHKIWSLADVDRDGAFTLYEFSLAMHFIKMKLDGQDLPASLPPQMLPTSEN